MDKLIIMKSLFYFQIIGFSLAQNFNFQAYTQYLQFCTNSNLQSPINKD